MDNSRYNEIASPMHLFEDGELLTREELRRRKEDAIEKQVRKAPFLVGTMALVNQRIGDLDQSLQDYTQLVLDSRMSDTEENEEPNGYPQSGSLASARHRRKVVQFREMRTSSVLPPVYPESISILLAQKYSITSPKKEAAELSRFSGVFSIHSAVGQAPERVKNVHKISMKAKKKERKKSAESSRAKPKFVELFTFPGYLSDALTPLPHNVTNAEIFEKVLRAQQQMKRRLVDYDDEFYRALHTRMSQAMLVDIYWWIFLDRYSSHKSFQPKFFNRISHNFVKFLNHVQDFKYREAILNNYPDTMAQAVYVSYSETFPDSYKQFGDDFKEYIIQVIFEWMTGILPAPRKFLQWSTELEPAGKKREAAMAKQPVKESKRAPVPDDWLSQIDAYSNAQRSLRRNGSELSINSRATSINTSKGGGVKVTRGQGSESSRSEESRNIEFVSEAQQQTKSKYPRPQALAHNKALTPVIETAHGSNSDKSDILGVEEEKSSNSQSASKERKSHVTSKRKSGRIPTKEFHVESHPACKGPDMVRSLFDVKGSCPLVAHYLKSYQLMADSGQQVVVNRTEMKNLPPIDAPTYRDVIKSTFKTIKSIEKGIHKHINQDIKEHSQFVIQQNKRAQFYRKKQHLLLNDPKEVKRLSNLLLLEHNAQREKVEKLAAAEKLDQIFEQALLAIDEPKT